MAVGFLEKLKRFNKDEVPDRIVKALDNFLKDTPELNLDEVKKSSSAGVSLCKWVFAIINYAKVAKEVEPLKKNAENM